MSGRFSQYHTWDDYIRALEMDDDIARYTNTIRRYNVAPGTRVLILRERDEKLRFDPVYWGYVPEW